MTFTANHLVTQTLEAAEKAALEIAPFGRGAVNC